MSAPKTRDDTIREVTTEYIEFLDPLNLPDAYTAQAELLDKTQFAIEMANTGILSKARKWDMAKRLTPWQIAMLMLRLDNVVKISFTGGDDTGYEALAIYVKEGPKAGTYTLSQDMIHSFASEYSINMSTRDLLEVDAILTRKAQTKEVCRERNLIAVGNGIFDFDTKTLLPFTPEKVFLSKSQVNYVPGAVNPVITAPSDGYVWDIETWMSELSDDEGVPELLWQIIGAVIRPNVSWNKAAWFYSEDGNNGKGTLCELMNNLCGGSSVSLPVAEMGKDFMLEQIVGKSAIITDENDVGTYVDKAANLKAIITGDAVMINRKFKRPITYRFRGFMVQCLNELPKIRDRSDSIHRRQLFVPFRKCYTGVERKYIKGDYMARQDVLEYVLRRVLEMDYYELSEPVACKELLDEYKVYNDPLKQFADDVFPRLAWDGVPFGFLYDLYVEWMKANIPGSTALGRHAFTHSLLQELKNWPQWYCKGQSAANHTGNLMDKYEPMIGEYQLKKWMDPSYSGNNEALKYRPKTLPHTFKGILRDKTFGQGANVSNVSEDDD